MARAFLIFALMGLPLLAQKPAEPAPAQHAEPAEEDAASIPREYEFNPIQAESELKVGRFHLKRGNLKGAAMRFEEALKWNPQSAEACLALGEVREKMKDAKAARAAYEKYLQLAPDAKDAADVKKRLAALKPAKS